MPVWPRRAPDQGRVPAGCHDNASLMPQPSPVDQGGSDLRLTSMLPVFRAAAWSTDKPFTPIVHGGVHVLRTQPEPALLLVLN